MTKKVNTNENVEETQSMNETMPAPQTINYEQKLKLSDKFVEDMNAALDSIAYVEVKDLFNVVENMRNEIPINILNEVIRRIASFPYKNVKNLMHVVETNQSLYWELLPNE